MKIDVYIIKKGSLEEALLSKIGIPKRELETVRSYYKARHYGGDDFVGYRVRGVEKVKEFCERILSVLTREGFDENLMFEGISLSDAARRRKLQDRAQRTLEAIKQHKIEAEKKSITMRSRTPVVERYLFSRYPLAEQKEIDAIVSSLNGKPGLTLEELKAIVDAKMNNKPQIWAKAQKDFVMQARHKERLR